jgi:hypothetical protein
MRHRKPNGIEKQKRLRDVPGARKAGEPALVESTSSPSSNTCDTLKSHSLTFPSVERSKLSGFTSLWMIPLEWTMQIDRTGSDTLRGQGRGATNCTHCIPDRELCRKRIVSPEPPGVDYRPG